ncbi:MAG: deoxyhypusine synthase [Infirmifilum sp.]|jgi:deoxyhypusine synthase|uniref:Deoxyhypusine synthase n=1 Tax=Infirmifilum uzonense TaxID=1550241 RepID=A0A0F7FJL7_9CREN|nr:deoxyhypusine synthase [Infirmifilum uzonense]AKG39113.1 deoxyhypusine synthase [Infirmifilum uzonense]
MSGDRSSLLQTPVVDLSLDEAAENAGQLVKLLEKLGGFSARYVVRSANILLEMYRSGATVIYSFPANLVATGLRGLLADTVRHGLVNAVITTGGTFDHDIARGLGYKYYVGEFELDDAYLKELEIHRLGNILVPAENYGPPVEGFTHMMLEELSQVKTDWSPSELAFEAGRRLSDEKSILRASHLKNTPVFAPGVVDGAFGTAVYTFNEKSRASSTVKPIRIDLVRDMEKIADIIYSAEKLGGVMLGGGISKHHTIWWAQFRGGLDYAVAVTSAPEWDGSLSGARTREAISWGKIKPKANHVTVPGDATIIFPVIIGYAARELGVV